MRPASKVDAAVIRLTCRTRSGAVRSGPVVCAVAVLWTGHPAAEEGAPQTTATSATRVKLRVGDGVGAMPGCFISKSQLFTP